MAFNVKLDATAKFSNFRGDKISLSFSNDADGAYISVYAGGAPIEFCDDDLATLMKLLEGYNSALREMGADDE